MQRISYRSAKTVRPQSDLFGIHNSRRARGFVPNLHPLPNHKRCLRKGILPLEDEEHRLSPHTLSWPNLHSSLEGISFVLSPPLHSRICYSSFHQSQLPAHQCSILRQDRSLLSCVIISCLKIDRHFFTLGMKSILQRGVGRTVVFWLGRPFYCNLSPPKGRKTSASCGVATRTFNCISFSDSSFHEVCLTFSLFSRNRQEQTAAISQRSSFSQSISPFPMNQ